MIFKPNVDETKVREALHDYINKYKEYLNEELVKYLFESYADGFFDYRTISDFLMEFYVEYDLVKPERNRYLEFSKIIQEKYNIKDSSILEVGAGTLPVLSKMLAEKTNKPVTAMDPYMYQIDHKIKNLKLLRQSLTETTSYDVPDLYVGMMPCDATEIIVKEAIKNRRNFIISMCTCDYGYNQLFSEYFPNNYIKSFINYTEQLLSFNDMGILYEAELESEISPPIFYTKIKK